MLRTWIIIIHHSTLDWMMINHSKLDYQVTNFNTFYCDPKPNQNQNPNRNPNPNPYEKFDLNFLNMAMSRGQKSFCL